MPFDMIKKLEKLRDHDGFRTFRGGRKGIVADLTWQGALTEAERKVVAFIKARRACQSRVQYRRSFTRVCM